MDAWGVVKMMADRLKLSVFSLYELIEIICPTTHSFCKYWVGGL